MKPFYTFLFFVLLQASILSQSSINDYDILTKLLSADDITSEDEIRSYISVYNEILTKSKNKIEEEENNFHKHKTLFDFLHDNYLKKYKDEAFINKLFKGKEFNCVTAVLLYQMICLDLGLKIELYETPYHVFITAQNTTKENFTIELTDPVDGFDIRQDKSDYIKFLLDYKLITEDELNEKGEEGVFNEFVSQTHKIDSNTLIAIYYSNIASYSVAKDSTLQAYKLIKKAVSLSPDSIRTQSLNYVWYLHSQNIKTDAEKYTSFLLENLDSIPVSKEFSNLMIRSSAEAVDLNMQKNNFDAAEKIFTKLYSVLPFDMLKDNSLELIEIAIKSNKMQNKLIRGDYEDAFIIATELYRRHKGNDKILDMYLHCGNIYMQNLGLNGETDKLIEVADSMFTNAPGIKSVESNYVLSCIQAVVNTGLYRTNPNKSKEILFTANKKLPNNEGITSTIGYLYHEMAMAEIRNRNYKKAIDILNEGLKYDPENWELKHEIDLTKGLLNKR